MTGSLHLALSRYFLIFVYLQLRKVNQISARMIYVISLELYLINGLTDAWMYAEKTRLKIWNHMSTMWPARVSLQHNWLINCMIELYSAMIILTYKKVLWVKNWPFVLVDCLVEQMNISNWWICAQLWWKRLQKQTQHK